MTKRTVPRTRSDWSSDAKSLWQHVHKHYVLDEHHRLMLIQCAELISRADACRDVLRKEGLTISKQGTTRPHPMLQAETQAINCLRLCLREIGLDFSDGGLSRTTLQESRRIPRTVGYA